MQVDYKYLGEALAHANLTGKAVNSYTRDEVDFLVKTCLAASAQPCFFDELRAVFLEKGVPAEVFYKFFNKDEVPF